MNVKHHFRGLSILLALLFFLTACAAGEALPLETFKDAQERFVFSIPQGWQSEQQGGLYTFTPQGFQGTPQDLRVLLLLSPTGTDDPQEHVSIASAAITDFLSTRVTDDYEIYNQGETKVAKFNATVLDFGKPDGEGFLSGREVIVAAPRYAMVFLGMGEHEAWKAFLPTFREMLKAFQFTLPDMEPLISP